MTEPVTPTPPAHRRPQGGSAASRPLSVLGILGEVLVTAGVVVLLYLGWQVWWQSWILSSQQTSAAAEQSSKWIDQATTQTTPPIEPTTPSPSATPTANPELPYGKAPVTATVGFAKPLGVLYIPRLGKDYKRVIKESVDEQRVLNDMASGIGHYTDTQMPGEPGNFAIAGHDTGWGNAFIDIGKLRVGDSIYIQTAKGYYTYKFRNFEFVQPNQVSVIAAVPRHPDAKPTQQFLTITTCNPHYHGRERLIAYSTFDSWQPLTAGPPAAIAGAVGKG